MISELAVVQTDRIGANVQIGEFAVIRKGVSIGDNVVIHPHVVIQEGVTIGDGVEIFPGAYIGKEPKGAGALARQPVFERRVVIGRNTSIGPHSVIYYDVEIGEQTLIGDGASIREKCRIGSWSVIGRHVTLNYVVTVGDHTKIMDHSWMAGNMSAGNNVFISGGVLTTNDNTLGLEGYSDEKMIGPTIEDGAMIGVGALLLPGVIIGKGAIVGAGAVVTNDIAPDTLVMGVPARFVRKIERGEAR
ncbi:MAG TPA: DapH/DapD/GlmU-related protein [Chloroflexia bacterium]|nr:DapH/DapD/GlmU-related protein [Chloroflexia bacterium]